MNVSDNIRTRAWSKLVFYDPKVILQSYRDIKIQLSGVSISERTRSLRTPKLRKHKEGLEAALLCYGIGKCVLGTTVYFSPNENSDYDFIAKWQIDDVEKYAPVQLKELAPIHLNNKDTITKLLSRLSKYTDSHDTIVGIYLNKNIDIDLSNLIIPKIDFAEIWLFGFNINSKSLFIYGNILSKAKYDEFDYPL